MIEDINKCNEIFFLMLHIEYNNVDIFSPIFQCFFVFFK